MSVSDAASVVLDAIEVALDSTDRTGGFSVDLSRNCVTVWERRGEPDAEAYFVADGLPELLELVRGIGLALKNGAALNMTVSPR